MTDLQSALEIIKNANLAALDPITIPLKNALNCVLAHNFYAPDNDPKHRISSMDGFAFNSKDLDLLQNSGLKISVIQKISQKELLLKPQTCAQIFTGARLPNGADTIIINEHVKIIDDKIYATKEPKPGTWIRQIGSSYQKGALLLKAKTILSPYHIAFLSAHVKELQVLPRIKIGVLSIGDELNTKNPAFIADTNTPLIALLAKEFGAEVRALKPIKDNPKILQKFIQKLLETSDLVVLCGGMSRGEFDVTRRVLNNLSDFGDFGDFEIILDGIHLKPGKESMICINKSKNKAVLGLSGNPNAAGIGFYILGGALIARFYDRPFVLDLMSAISQNDIAKTDSRLELRACNVTNQNGKLFAHFGDKNESFMLNNLCKNALAILDKPSFAKNDEIMIIKHHIFRS
ncbi:MAG: molybdopterin molybdotransferase MoeA [Helicobacter sp.]|nr:molybdopterin molybdotransferase MoeA [Helicobacter sp.]